jgi:[acyl-carrier-protein] S-malonyltransferase
MAEGAGDAGEGPLAALFPGQGSQALGMGLALYRSSQAARSVIIDAEAALPGLTSVMWEGPAEALRSTANTQPALLAVSVAAFAAWHEAGGPAFTHAAGHSLGEYSALVAAGSLSLADALPLVRARGEAMQRAVPAGAGAMAAILKTDAAHVERVLAQVDGVVEIANRNGAQQTVISGAAEAVAEASERLRQGGARAVPLEVSGPFHCSLMASAAAELAPRLAATPFATPTLQVVANVTADVIGSGDEARALLERQVTGSVRWLETLERLHADGVRRFVEFGVGGVLAGLVKRALPDVTAVAVTDPESLREALAALFDGGAAGGDDS